MCVRANREDLIAGIGANERVFPYSLSNPGDMGMQDSQINGGRPFFNHGPAIAKDNDANEEIFSYVGALWQRLEPDYKPHTEQITLSSLAEHDYIDVDYSMEGNVFERED
jgi:hypothetical protein